MTTVSTAWLVHYILHRCHVSAERRMTSFRFISLWSGCLLNSSAPQLHYTWQQTGARSQHLHILWCHVQCIHCIHCKHFWEKVRRRCRAAHGVLRTPPSGGCIHLQGRQTTCRHVPPTKHICATKIGRKNCASASLTNDFVDWICHLSPF